MQFVTDLASLTKHQPSKEVTKEIVTQNSPTREKFKKSSTAEAE